MAQNEIDAAEGFRARVLEDGTTELVVPRSGGIGCALLFGLFWGGAGVFAILNPTGWEAGPATPFLLFAGWVIPGLWLITTDIHHMTFERRWLVRAGEVAWRRRLRHFGRTTDGPFEPLRQVEVRHGIWKTGRGCTDIARFYREGSERATAIRSVERRCPKGSVRESHASREELEAEIDPTVLALARTFAARARRRLEIVVEMINEPSSE